LHWLTILGQGVEISGEVLYELRFAERLGSWAKLAESAACSIKSGQPPRDIRYYFL
jgi:hypothetical protein